MLVTMPLRSVFRAEWRLHSFSGQHVNARCELGIQVLKIEDIPRMTIAALALRSGGEV